MNHAKKAAVLCACIIFLLDLASMAYATNVWWNSDWHYRFSFNVNTSSYNRTDWPVEIYANFTEELRNSGASRAFDPNSLRVIEYTQNGSVVRELNSQFERLSGYNQTSNAVGNVIFILNGTNAPNALRYFSAYFDTAATAKTMPNYNSSLRYSFDGNEFGINSSVLELKVDTFRSENTSGLYYARRIDSSKTIFNTPDTERTVEYIQYYNSTNLLAFNFTGNASIILNGSAKLVIEQIGNEVVWDTATETGTGRMIKQYTIYENSSWIKIKQIFQNTGASSISRSSSGVNALALDAERAFGIDSLSTPTSDPFSWRSAYKSSTAVGLGAINYNETSTTNYAATGSIVSGKVGIQLSSTNISAGENISEEAAILFNDQADHNPVQDLRDRLATPVIVTKNNSEAYAVNISASTNYTLYNLNETIVVNANVTTDNFNQTRYVNATLSNGTAGSSDDITIALYDDGQHLDIGANDNVYGGNYTIKMLNNIGNWSVIAIAYDVYFQQLANSTTTINVTNQLVPALQIINPIGIIDRIVNAIFTLFNARQDTPIAGATINCSTNNTVVANISYTSNGNYSMNFTAPSQVGTYNLTCNGTLGQNTATAMSQYTTESGTTSLNMTVAPGSTTLSSITQTANNSFILNVTIFNVGSGTASLSNITITVPNSNFTSNASASSCGNLAANGNCTKNFLITGLKGTSPGNYTLIINATWIEPNQSLSSIGQYANISVASNPVMDVAINTINSTVIDGSSSYLIGNFSVNSTGNDAIVNVSYNCTAGTVCQNFSISFIPTNMSSMNAGNTTRIDAYITVPDGFTAGNYSGLVNITSANGGTDSVNVSISVPETLTWEISTGTCSSTVLINASGNVCLIRMNNTGNVQLNFTMTPSSVNYTSLNQTNITTSKQQQSQFYIVYNTTSASQGTYVGTYIVNSSGATPATATINITLEIVFGPNIESLITTTYAQQRSTVNLRANVTDRSSSGLSYVKANITLPNSSIDTLNFSVIVSAPLGGTSTWEYNFTNTLVRGNYSILLYSKDISNGTGSTSDSIIVYAKINISMITGWQDYLLGETASIYFNTTDAAGTAISATANISLYDSNGNLRQRNNYTTNSNGKLDIIPTFTIPDDAPTGNYTLASEAAFNDTISGLYVNSTLNYTFGVYDDVFAQLDTVVVWYPDSTMTFYILVYSTGTLSNAPTAINLTVYDPAQAVYTSATLSSMSLVQSTSSSRLYKYQYAMPGSTANGNYLAIAKVSQGTRSVQDLQSFRVSSGGPYDLGITITDNEVEKGSYVPFDILIANMGEVSQDVFLDYWVRDLSNNTYSMVTNEAIYVASIDNKTISRTLYIYPSQATALHEVIVRMTYSDIEAPITTSSTFSVIAASAPSGTPAGAGGAGGGGGVAIPGPLEKVEGEAVTPGELKDKLIVTDIDPDELDIEREGISYVLVELRNIADIALSNVRVSIDVDGYTNVSTSEAIPRLAPNERTVVPVRVSIPDTLQSGAYNGKVNIISDQIVTSKNYQIHIFDSKEELIINRLVNLKLKLEKLKHMTMQAEKDGFDVGNVMTLIEEVNRGFMITEEYIKAKKFLRALEQEDFLENKIEEGEYVLDATIAPQKGLFRTENVILAVIALALISIAIILVINRKRLPRLPAGGFAALKEKYLPKKKEEQTEKEEHVDLEESEKEPADTIDEHLKILEDQFRFGYISQETYKELTEQWLKEKGKKH